MLVDQTRPAYRGRKMLRSPLDSKLKMPPGTYVLEAHSATPAEE
jgi:hypothetical protein